MNRIVACVLCAVLFLWPSPSLLSQTPAPKTHTAIFEQYAFITQNTCGVTRFRTAYPEADGSGVIIVIVDTGVDMTIPGLMQRPDGQTKVIEVRDFSGAGDIALTPIAIPRTDSIRIAGRWVKGIMRFTSLIEGNELFIGLYDEASRLNSEVSDLDGDGQSESVFAVLGFPTATGDRMVFDTNGDGDFSDETMIASYRDNTKSFAFRNTTRDNEIPMSMAASLFLKERRIELHCDDGAHGSHCAGIAGGYGIFGSPSQKGINGIAPGVEVISLKISDGSIGHLTTTGSMLRALLYAAAISDTSKKPIVINMSFGVPSLREGGAEMETILDTLILNHPNLYLVTSNGNEGPGLSTTGLPAGSREAISVGAYLPSEVAADLYGTELTKSIMWSFSSRGGEYAKPDLVAPGSAVSSVPAFYYSPLMSGTSMASPYVAGAIALLLSQLQREGHSLADFPQRVIKKALMESARPIEGMTRLDVGAGLLDVPKAYDRLLYYKKISMTEHIHSYRIGFAGKMDGTLHSAGYYRGGVPRGVEVVSILPVFPAHTSEEKEKTFTRLVSIRSTSQWLIAVQKTVLINGRVGTSISYRIDKDKLSAPGLYTASLIGERRLSHKGSSSNDPLWQEFEAPVTIIIPHSVPRNPLGGELEIKLNSLKPGDVHRHFFVFPPGLQQVQVSAMFLTDDKGIMNFTLCAPEGKELTQFRLSGDEPQPVKESIALDEKGGVYELVVSVAPTATVKKLNAILTVALDPLRIQHGLITPESISFSLFNHSADMLTIPFAVEESGIARQTTVILKATPTMSRRRMKVLLLPKSKSLSLTLSLSGETYNLNTDIGIAITDSTGKKLVSKTIGYYATEIEFEHTYTDSAAVWVEVYFGFATINPFQEARLHIVEKQYFKTPIPIASPTFSEHLPFEALPYQIAIPPSGLSMPKEYFRLIQISFFDEASKGRRGKKEYFISPSP